MISFAYPKDIMDTQEMLRFISYSEEVLKLKYVNANVNMVKPGPFSVSFYFSHEIDDSEKLIREIKEDIAVAREELQQITKDRNKLRKEVQDLQERLERYES